MQHKATHVKLTDELLDKKRVVADTEVFVRDTVTTGFAVMLYPNGSL